MNIFEVKIFNHIKKKITKTTYLIIFSSLIILSCQTTQSTTKVLNNNSNIEKTLSDFPITKTEFEENEEIRVGLLLPMKGQNYRIGKSLLNAIHLALYKTQNKNIKIFVRDILSIEGVTNAYYEFLDLNINLEYKSKKEEQESIKKLSEPPEDVKKILDKSSDLNTFLIKEKTIPLNNLR